MKTLKIGALSGSLRKASFCGKIIRAMCEFMPDDIEITNIRIGGLPLYNQDFDDENRAPREWTEFRQLLESFDGFLFVTPEYNRSLSAPLKNALDIASRPQGENKWNGKPGAIIGVTIGKLGALGACHALRQTLGFLNIYLLNQPEMYIANAAALFNEKDELNDTQTRQYFSVFAEKFSEWMRKFS